MITIGTERINETKTVAIWLSTGTFAFFKSAMTMPSTQPMGMEIKTRSSVTGTEARTCGKASAMNDQSIM